MGIVIVFLLIKCLEKLYLGLLMKFSEYIVIESTGSSVDPLGFLRPSSAIADGLFKQFTVLSNHPAYQGFLG